VVTLWKLCFAGLQLQLSPSSWL